MWDVFLTWLVEYYMTKIHILIEHIRAYLYPLVCAEESQQPEGDDNETLLFCTESVCHWGAK